MTAATLQSEILDFTVSFESFGSALVDATVARQRDEIPEFLVSEEAGDAADVVVRDAAAVGVAVALSAIRVPYHLPSRSPAASAREARLAAQQSVPRAALTQSYRVGHAVFQEHFLVHGARVGCSLAALRAVTRNMFTYVDWLLPLAEQEYDAERRRLDAAPDRAWFERVRRVLAGRFDEDLGHPLDGAHVALVTRGAEDVFATLAAALGTTGISVKTPHGEHWAWLAADDLAEDELGARLAQLDGVGVAGVGPVETGPKGFVASHRKARLACQLGARRGARVSRYADVALEALAFGGPDAAREFAQKELGTLASDDDRAAVLRDTLRVYFAEGASTPAAARALGIAERTVTYRLRRAEELIARPLSTRRTELETALRLHRLFMLSA
jgi:PucR-like helix-turn-helix protein/diguanylate cyclase with GGDEF domain